MESLQLAKECPRKAFLSQIPNGLRKTQQLKSVMKDVLEKVDYKTPLTQVEALVAQAFQEKVTTMFPFETENEQKRMVHLINRYLAFESGFIGSKVICQNESVKIKFAGKMRQVTVGKLVDRGNGQLTAIRYFYEAPPVSVNSTKYPIQENPDLCMLFLAGQALAKRHKVKYSQMFGSHYFLKSTLDNSTALDPFFEDKPGTNVMSHCFVTGQIQNLEKMYATIAPSPDETICDPAKCKYCSNNDLCNLEFIQRKEVPIEHKEEKKINELRLTPSQYELVTFDKGVCRVNAVAGSGKTTVITLRTIRLLEEGVDPKKILMLTFTDKAKGEMKERLLAYAKGDALCSENLDVESVQVQNFNSWGQAILDQCYEKLGFTQKPILIDDVTKKDIILDLLDHYRMFPIDYRNPFLNTKNAKGCVTSMVELIDSMKSAHVSSPAEALEAIKGNFAPVQNELYEFYLKYNERLMAENLIDFEDQLRLILKLEQYGVFHEMDYEHLIVDEFQDSNPNQIGLIARIKANDQHIKSLVVVGDDMQSIYKFRNATPENLILFDRLFPGTVDINLEDNFRSQIPIVTVANRILANESKIKKVILAHRQETGIDPVILDLKEPDERSLFVRQTKKLLKDGRAPSSIAILCRTKGELIKIQESLSAANIPAMLRVPEIMGDAPFVKAVIALAAFFKDNENLLSLALFAKSVGQNPFDHVILKKSAESLLLSLAAQTTEAERIQFFFDLCEEAEKDYVAHDFLEALKNKSFKTLQALVSYCVKYKKYETKEPHATSREEAEAVTLITVHSSKGLEWETVLLSLKKFRNDEEERRLLYVAVTRAKERLLITHQKKQQALIDLLSA